MPSAPHAAPPDRSIDVTWLKSRLQGDVLVAADDGYEAARQVWNGMIHTRPAAIVRCRGAADVVTTINFARDQGAALSIRGGGHNVAGLALCEGGVTLD